MPYQLKLGPGGIRDIEFTVQLLQLVHGLSDDRIRQRGTLEALDALVAEGYIGRPEAAAFSRDYRVLRLLEHRVQLRQPAPHAPDALATRGSAGPRPLARGLADTGEQVWSEWESVKREVRDIHVRLFYRPLLSAVAALPAEERALSPEQAHDRLAAIGFADPAGALRHIAALTSGLSRKATIQRHLMPVMIRWFADGVDPDYGLLTFRRLSERLGDTPWFLRMLRDSSGAAESLTRVLSGSRYVGELMEWIPESAAWLDDRRRCSGRAPGVALQEEARAIQTRHATIDDAMRSVRALRRRELLRIAMAAILGTIDDRGGRRGAHHDHRGHDPGDAARRASRDRSAGGCRPGLLGHRDGPLRRPRTRIRLRRRRHVRLPARTASTRSAPTNSPLQLVAALRKHSEDHRVPLDLDADLRPEGRNGPIARSLDAYAEYYRRWSLSWEAQALLRARGVAGSVKLIQAFTELADDVRYPESVDPQGLREIKRIKARVENERLPQGADPARHLKLGPGRSATSSGSSSCCSSSTPTPCRACGRPRRSPRCARRPRPGSSPPAPPTGSPQAWRLASRLRSANTLLSGQTSDVLPTDRKRLDGIGRLLEYPPRSATQVEEDYLGTTRRARRVFEKLFYG